MDPTTSGRFRVHDRRPRPAIEDEGADGDHVQLDDPTSGGDDPAPGADAERPDEFVLVELPDGPVDPNDPNAADQFDPLYATAEGYAGDLAERVSALEPGFVVEATLAWTDGSARFVDIDVVRESRFHFADEVEGMFEAAVETWRQIRADGEAVGSITTRSNDGDPNGALYLFADAPGGDTFADLRAGRLPIEPLVARVNEFRDDGPREVFVLRPIAHDFVAVYVVFDRDGVLAQTVRDTYGLGPGLAAGLEAGEFEAAKADSGDGSADEASGDTGDADGDFDALDRL
ncbi:hypothetical protein C461_01422 [Halorubrum aidingense JCM 13560]|uniref:Uncharacterized protein n=1 Tax=Halorubrum aidingense JCM 13560 TaxID=1230454 RepID=M0PKF5_9EURY|nr:DUF6663 family protein [Halorubrum aidingense]EMA70099.1 hypothetical protein C461_01422 [Halorubrum aidingense JCM 13560]